MYPRFRPPMNADPPRGTPGPFNRQWQGFEEPSYRQRPPFIPFSPPHVAGRFAPFRPNHANVNDYPQQYHDKRRGCDSQWPRPRHNAAPFRGHQPEDVNPTDFPDRNHFRTAPYARGRADRLQYHHDNNPDYDGGETPGPWRGRGGFGRGMKRFPNTNRNMDVPQKKKRKIKEKPTGDSCPFYCEACDRGYQVEEKYKEHLSTHIKCGWDGCPYVAAAKLVQIHRDQQHRTGLAKKIWQLETREDIDKWIAERKKNYPTKDTVTRKQHQLEDKIRRGERLETRQFGRFGRGRGRGRGWHHRNQRTSSAEHETTGDSGTSRKPNNNTKAGDPLSFGVSSEQLDSDSDKEVTAKSDGDVSMNNLCGALGSIMSSYSFDSDTEQVDGREKNKSTETPILNNKTAAENRRKRQQEKRNRHKNQQNCKPRHESLLEKLLANEIRHERNVLLQCIRYIVQENFFQLPPVNHSVPDFPEEHSTCGKRNKQTKDSKMTNECIIDDNSAKVVDEAPHLMAPPGEQDMDVSEQPTVEEVSDSEMTQEQSESLVTIQDVSDQPVILDGNGEMRSQEKPTVNLQDAADLPCVQDPEVIDIEDISGDPDIEELSDNNSGSDRTPLDDDTSEEPSNRHPIVQDVVDKPVVDDPPGTPVILDITGFPKIKDLSDSKKREGKDDDDDVSSEEESSSSACEDQAIVDDVVDAPFVQDPSDTPIIQDITSLPIICDIGDSPSPSVGSDEPSTELGPEASSVTDDEPIVQDDADDPVIQDPAETLLILDVSNQLIIQDVTDPDAGQDTKAEPSTSDTSILDPFPFVQNVPDDSVGLDTSDPEAIQDNNTTPSLESTTETIIIEEILEQTSAGSVSDTSQH